MAKYWVPDLVARLAKDPKKWKPLAIQLFRQLDTNDDTAIAALEPLAKSSPADLRAAALQGLVQSSAMRSSDGNHYDDKAEAAVASALKSNDPQLIGVALAMLRMYEPTGQGGAGSATVKPKLTFQHEVVPLLLHSDEKVRQEARGELRWLDQKYSPPIAEKLIHVLENPNQQADRIHAIRALAALSGTGRPRQQSPTWCKLRTPATTKKPSLAQWSRSSAAKRIGLCFPATARSRS